MIMIWQGLHSKPIIGLKSLIYSEMAEGNAGRLPKVPEVCRRMVPENAVRVQEVPEGMPKLGLEGMPEGCQKECMKG